MSRSCAGVVVVRFCQVSDNARMWMLWDWIMSLTATERLLWNSEWMFRVPSVMLDGEGPGLRLTSPDRMTSSVTMELKCVLSDDDMRRGFKK
jgi:hypothetical protein